MSNLKVQKENPVEEEKEILLLVDSEARILPKVLGLVNRCAKELENVSDVRYRCLPANSHASRKQEFFSLW